ncbi:MAG: branched chain amino acid aminotransferase [Porticoccaceae bacterium]|nr:MAG: branched chain amino acid aminotransferase [Porticoccaceae bacterium]
MTAFGTRFIPEMIVSWYDGERWSEPQFAPSDRLVIHPGAHVLHYASTCFEGLKAFRHPDGSVKIFRLDRNLARLAESSRLLALPPVDEALTGRMIVDLVARYREQVPTPPGSMYIRPTHIGTEPAIGKAASPSRTSCLYVLLSPVGRYFAEDTPALRILVEEEMLRCAPHMGMVKSGGNYASALGPTLRAAREHGVQQVLFCPGGDVQETGAANFLLIDGDTLITKALDSSFLHGVTRDSILTLARDLGLAVEERDLTVAELLERAAKPHCEAALSGTAAVLTAVGTLVYRGREYPVGRGTEGPVTARLRQALTDIQTGLAEDRYGWLTPV